MWRWLVVCLLGGCTWLVKTFDCPAPDDLEYECQPLPAGSTGCVGGPQGSDPHKVFPVGCKARLPYCDDIRPGDEVDAFCSDMGETPPAWLIPD